VVHNDDVCHIIANTIENEKYSGLINLVSQESVSNKSFAQTLINSVFRIDLLFSVPAFLLKILLGEMSAILLDVTDQKYNRLQ
jgi:uncharacterized protein